MKSELDRRTILQALGRLSELLGDRGVKGEISAQHEASERDLPQFEHLRLIAPTAGYMLAMKCIASRIPVGSEDRGDVADIAFLIGHLGLTSPEDALAIVAKYYPEEQIPARARFIIEDVFAQRKRD